MEIERINEHTVKFYISYGDIEDRGLTEKKSGTIANAVKSCFGK